MNLQEIFSTQNVYFIYFIRILLSYGCGLILGIERKVRRNAVGIRTLVLISVSSCLLSILSGYVAEIYPDKTDAARISAAVVTGIGFLGGGAIFRQGANIRGLTTATIIWTSSALGLASGAGLYFPTVLILIITLSILGIMNKIEKKVFPSERTKTITLEFESLNVQTSKIKEIMESYGILIYDTDIIHSLKNEQLEIQYSIKTPNDLDAIKLSKDMAKLGNLTKFTISE